MKLSERVENLREYAATVATAGRYDWSAQATTDANDLEFPDRRAQPPARRK